MFGKRANRSQSDNSDFPVDEFDATAEAEMAEVTDEWAGDDEADTQPVRRSGSGLAKLIPFVAIGLVAAGGAGYFYLNYMAPKAAAPSTGEVIAAAPIVDPSAETLASQPLTEEAPNDTPVAAEAIAQPEIVSAAADVVTEPAPVTDALPVEMSPDALTNAEPVAQPATEAVSEVIEPVQPQVAASPIDAATELSAPVGEVVADSVQTEQPAIVASPPAELQPIQDLAPVSQDAAAQSSALAELPVSPSASATVENASASSEGATETNLDSATPATETASGSTDTTMRLAVVEHQMSDIAKAVDGLVSDKSAQSAAAALTAQVAALEAQVKSLQNELRDLRANPAAVATASTVKAPATTDRTEPAATKPQPVKKPAAATAPAARSQWVLRAAQSGEAWVSRGAQGSLQSVKVGDSLPGIGRITNIAQRDGVWVVVGTTGSLKQ